MNKPIRVAILASRQVSMFELGCALELFALPRKELNPGYQTEVVTFEKGGINAIGGLTLQLTQVSSLKNYDTLIVPGWDTVNRVNHPSLLQEITQFHHQGGRILSFCSGSFLLAETGLLNKLEVTTHWRYAELFQQRFPKIQYIDHRLYTLENHIGCSAGSAAALDLGLEIIRQDYGDAMGTLVARQLVVAPHRKGGQSQYVDTTSILQKNSFSTTLNWAIENIHNKITITDLALKSNMSRRTFDRHFRRSLDMSAKEWLTRQRLKCAQKLLESNQSSMEFIAAHSGFESAMNMRHYFRRFLGISPSQFRAQFQ